MKKFKKLVFAFKKNKSNKKNVTTIESSKTETPVEPFSEWVIDENAFKHLTFEDYKSIAGPLSWTKADIAEAVSKIQWD